jgi:molecular chaperone DnaJ
MSSKRDYYELLGCAREVSHEDLRKAYKREAMRLHPDRNPGDAKAEAGFKEVNEAYQVLSDEEKRRAYDQFGHAAFDGSMQGFDGGIGDVFSHMQDLFSEMFSGGGGFGGQRQQRRGADLRVQQRLTLEEAAFGVKREVTVHAPTRCGDCSGSGAKAGTRPETCPQCRGAGHVSNQRGFVMFTASCPRCQGAGVVVKQACKSCEGRGVVQRPRKVTVAFPAGIDAGQKLRVPGQGMPGPQNAQAGDLYVEVDVAEDPRFERDGVDLVTRVHVSFVEASLGAQIEVPALEPASDGAEGSKTLAVTIAAGTQSGSVLSVKGHGVPRLDGRGRGSLVVIVQVDVPTTLSDRGKELLAELAAELQPAASEDGRRRAVAAK